MPTVHVDLAERSYDITIKPGLLNEAGEVIAGIARGKKIALVSQKKVSDLYSAPLLESLRKSGFDVSQHLVPDGERAKSLYWVSQLYSQFASAKIDRSCLVVALGGGAVGDLAGFAAASWLRGVDFVQVPTTLLSQVDASVGGKVGVNLPVGKNLVGAFWQPKAVLIDTETCRTLSPRDLRSGLSEVIKYGIILDREFFEYCHTNRSDLISFQDEAAAHAIARSCQLKAYVVTNDERESGLRAILNFGHTVGHAVEAAGKYAHIRHGEAVAIGMAVAADLSVDCGMLDKTSALLIREVIRSYGLPVDVPVRMDADSLLKTITLDKKTKAGRTHFILAEEIGKVTISDQVTPQMVKNAIIRSQNNARKPQV